MGGKINSQDLRVVSSQNNKEREYWLTKLSGEWKKSVLAYDHYPAKSTPGEIKRTLKDMHFTLPAQLCEKMMEIADGSDIRLYSLLLAVGLILINKHTENDDIIIGAPIYRQEIEGEGEFINTILPLRNQVKGKAIFKDLLIKVSRNLFEATVHQNYPIKTLLYKINIPHSTGDFFPLFDVAILLENIHDKRYLQDINVNLILSFSRNGSEVKGALEYNYILYEEKTIARIINHITHLLQVVLFDINVIVSTIDLLSPGEKKQLLYDFNDTAAAYPQDKTLHQLFEEQVTKTPNKVAVIGVECETWAIEQEQHLTYKELNEKTSLLARFLRKKGIKPDTIVGIMMNRSIEFIVGIIGILKAGGAFLPIDLQSPENRIIAMLEDSQARILLTKSRFDNKRNCRVMIGQELLFTDTKPLVTGLRQQITDLDRLPIPDRSLVNYEKFQQHIGMGHVRDSITIQATRGCPYKCAYCHKIWPKTHVHRTAQHIFNEVNLYYKMGIRRFVFVDDIFNLNERNSTKFFQLVIENGLDAHFFFPNGVRVDIMTEEYIDLMIKAGTIMIGFPLETASLRLQKLVGKNLDLEKFKKNIEYVTRKYPHVILDMFIMYGFPTETREEALETFNFMKSVKWLHFPSISMVRIFPGTDMAKIALGNGISRQTIENSVNLAYHELPDTLPFDKHFSLKCQADFLDNYFLSKERLLSVLPRQMNVLSEDELVEKYNSYLPMEIKCFTDLLMLAKIEKKELEEAIGFNDDHKCRSGFNRRLKNHFGKKVPSKDALKILLLDLSQFFSSKSGEKSLYEVVEAPLGLMYLLTYLNHRLGHQINGKIAKSKIDFDSYAELKALLDEFAPDLIGIRTLSHFRDFFHQTAAVIRQWGIDAPIITGGPYATTEYKRNLQDQNVELVVLGEGEITFGELVEKMIENNGQMPPDDILKEIPGLAFIPQKIKNRGKLPWEIVVMDALEPDENNEEKEETSGACPSNLAYTIFTSGSTGRPKGVLVEHQQAVNYICWATKKYVKNEPLNYPLHTSISFDLTITSIFSPLVTGNTIVVYQSDESKGEVLIENIIEDNKVGIIKLTPSHLKIIRDLDIKNADEKLRRFIVGGEVLETLLAEDIYNHFAGEVEIYNEYGPTETTVGCMIHQFTPGSNGRESVPIGVPADNTRIYLLDRYLQPVPLGILGEIFIAGDGVSRGYLNSPQLTKKNFIANPFFPGCRMYRSGDLGRRLPDGTIEMLGRIDKQVKIRGARIDPGEIESQLLKQKNVKDAVVLARDDVAGDKYLCAYLVPHVLSSQARADSIDVADLKEHLSREIPDYMIPSFFIILETIPLTISGKVNKSLLPAPEIGPSITECAAPRNKTDEKLIETWCEILGIEKEKLSIDANFFDLGGHSLKTTLLLSRIHKVFNTKIPMAKIFDSPTIRHLSDCIKTFKEEKFYTILPQEKKEYYPVSSYQRRLYILQQMEIRTINYNALLAITITGDMEKEKLEFTFKKLVKRHESFRTSFEMVKREPVQRIHQQVDFHLEYTDLFKWNQCQATPKPTDKDMVERFLRPFDLSSAPLLRVGMVKLEKQKFILMMDMHHIISDGVSMDVFFREFIVLYGGKTLPPQKIQYKDFSQWQQEENKKEFLKSQEKYWLGVFEGDIPVLNIPTDFPRPPILTSEGSRISFKIEKELTRKLELLAAKTGATLYMVLLAVYTILLSKYTLQEDIVVGSVSGTRRHADLQSVIGFFINILPMRNHPAGDKTFNSFLGEVKENAVNAYENQDYQFEELIWKLNPSYKKNRQPLVETLFVLYNVYIQTDQLTKVEIPKVKLSQYQVEHKTAKYDLSIGANETPYGLLVTIEYRTRLFKKKTIERICRHFRNIIVQVTDNPHMKISGIQMLGKEERNELIKEMKNEKKRNRTTYNTKRSEEDMKKNLQVKLNF